MAAHLRQRGEERRDWARSARGFTLVEVLVAAVVLTVGLLFVFTAFLPGSQDVAYAGRVSQAAMRAQQQLEALKAGPFPPANGTATSGMYSLTWTVTSVGFGAAPHALRKVTITVTWPQAVRPGRYDLVGFLSRPY